MRSERTALEALKYNGWELEAALEAYFNHCALASPSSLLVAFSEQRPVPPVVCQALSPLFSRNARVRGISAAGAFGGPKVDTAKIEAFFDAYKDESGELVTGGVGCWHFFSQICSKILRITDTFYQEIFEIIII